jgi:hypothetical protein
MGEQPQQISLWYLDLDGIKSGPYEPQEILSLLAEGEVLPHHQISTQLKDEPWISLLEWRLKQANLIHTQTNGMEPEVIEAPEPTSEPWPFEKTAVRAIQPPPMNLTQSDAQTKPPEPITEVTNPQINLANHQPMSGTDRPVKKRDPVAEMYDMLQTTKQKREAKSLVQAKEAELNQKKDKEFQYKGAKKASVFTPRLLGTLGLITLVGFILGQWMQKANGPSNDTGTHQASSTPAQPSATAAPSVVSVTNIPDSTSNNGMQSPLSPGTEERRVGKVTIRSKTSNSPTTNDPQSAETAEEIAQLKKDLEEIKNLRDEIKRGRTDEEPEVGHSTTPVDPMDPAAPMPNNTEDMNSEPSPLTDPTLHY